MLLTLILLGAAVIFGATESARVLKAIQAAEASVHARLAALEESLKSKVE